MTENKIKLNSIPEAINAIKNGEVIIVVDDANRENEGDFVAAAEKITPTLINFMATHGRGLICTPLTEERCQELKLGKMVSDNTDPMDTAFTVSVDLKGNGVTSGISASDRSKTIKALVDLRDGRGEIDDIDHLGNRRVRSVGELMENQYRLGLLRMERAIRERMSSANEIENLMPQDLINAKPAEPSNLVKKLSLSSPADKYSLKNSLFFGTT